ncbi:MAG: hypothetical protein CMH56_10250 [Myxococcales bacterium]|nr:hypothetical protein [Myxococcales bacterium]|tara:strand:+ start:880 stop:1227 length:348 start_codon:yes stop_codon:yes gene_type:complete
MADEHRRVEPRGIVGTGMAADPDHIRDLEAEYARRERQDRERPQKSFASTLEETPPMTLEEALEEEAEPQAKADKVDSAQKETEAPLPQVDLSERDLGETISSADLQRQLMRFRR